MSIGEHSYEIRYSGDKIYPSYSKKGKFNLDYYFYLDSYQSYNYGADNYIEVSFNNLATGNVIFTVDGKNYTEKIDDDCATLKLPKLSIGVYPISVTYLGNDIFGPKTLKGEIEIDYGIIIENDYVDLTLPQDAKGDLIVSIYDGDDNLLNEYSQTLKEGKASISLTDLDYGEYYVEAYYTGEDYSISRTSSPIWADDSAISVEDIKVNWPEDIILNSDKYITIDLPEKSDKSLLNVTLLDDYGNVIIEAVGQTSIKIPTTELKGYQLKVYYGENYVEDSYFDIQPLKVDIPDWYENVKLGEIISVEMPENAKGKIILTLLDYMTGNLIKIVESSPSVAGKTSIALENLTPKMYFLTSERI